MCTVHRGPTSIVLSIFAKIQQLPLLFAVFNQEDLHIAGAVENEIRIGALKGFHFAQDITALLTQEQIQTHHPLPIDEAFMMSLLRLRRKIPSNSEQLIQFSNESLHGVHRRGQEGLFPLGTRKRHPRC